MSNVRLIARLDVKNANLIKGINLEGLRVIGPASDSALKYYQEGVDEIIIMDAVASLYGRRHLREILETAAKNIFVPITVGGGIRTVEDVTQLLRSGADKVALNTAAVQRPSLISEVAEKFGSQAVVLSVEAKRIAKQEWEVYIDNGREKTGLNVFDWIESAEKLGAGEILLTSVDQEGTKKGFDIELTNKVSEMVKIPVIASGGMGTLEHFKEVVTRAGVNAVAIASMLHYELTSINEIRSYSHLHGIEVRHHE